MLVRISGAFSPSGRAAIAASAARSASRSDTWTSGPGAWDGGSGASPSRSGGEPNTRRRTFARRARSRHLLRAIARSQTSKARPVSKRASAFHAEMKLSWTTS